jgi:hypothetical protein
LMFLIMKRASHEQQNISEKTFKNFMVFAATLGRGLNSDPISNPIALKHFS